MSHPLDRLFRPRSVAIIGASSDPNRIGGRPVRFTKHAFKGAIVPINPNQKEIQGLTAYRIDQGCAGRDRSGDHRGAGQGRDAGGRTTASPRA